MASLPQEASQMCGQVEFEPASQVLRAHILYTEAPVSSSSFYRRPFALCGWFSSSIQPCGCSKRRMHELNLRARCSSEACYLLFVSQHDPKATPSNTQRFGFVLEYHCSTKGRSKNCLRCTATYWNRFVWFSVLSPWWSPGTVAKEASCFRASWCLQTSGGLQGDFMWARTVTSHLKCWCWVTTFYGLLVVSLGGFKMLQAGHRLLLRSFTGVGS